jgi:hypothetical protein
MPHFLSSIVYTGIDSGFKISAQKSKLRGLSQVSVQTKELELHHHLEESSDQDSPFQCGKWPFLETALYTAN